MRLFIIVLKLGRTDRERDSGILVSSDSSCHEKILLRSIDRQQSSWTEGAFITFSKTEKKSTQHSSGHI